MKVLKIASKIIVFGLTVISIYLLVIALFGNLRLINIASFLKTGALGLLIPELTDTSSLDISLIMGITSVFFIIFNFLMLTALEEWSSLGYKTFMIMLWSLSCVLVIGSLGIIIKLIFLFPAIYILLSIILRLKKDEDKELENEIEFYKEKKQKQILKIESWKMKILRILSIITVIMQIGPLLFFLMLGSIYEYLPFSFEVVMLTFLSIFAMATPMFMGKMLILITIHCLVLGALMNKGTEVFKKVVMLIYLALGIFYIVYSVTQSGYNVVEGLFSGLRHFAIFFLPSIVYLHRYIQKTKKSQKIIK